ncbi:MAG: hypothetical protein ACC645_05910 [Pirellulales bacterium]
MNAHLAAISAIESLLTCGETRARDVECLEAGTRLGLWTVPDGGQRCVATRALVDLGGALPNRAETIAAVFACEPDLRSAWLRIIAARLREAGKRRDAAELCHAIDQLGAASGGVQELLTEAKLEPTGHGELEIALLGAAAEQAVVWPKLLRAIGATADLVKGEQAAPADAVAPVQPLDPARAWCSGRVLQLPSDQEITDESFAYVLTGSYGPLAETEHATDAPGQALMRWVLYRPWVMLLAQITFTQEAWEAEQISGLLGLELGDDQMANPYAPSRVDVVVTTADGEEVVCGTLRELCLRVRDRLGVTLLARPEEVRRLDERLRPLVHRLLEKKVWRFEPRGGSGRRPGYIIDETFSTSCYRAFGSKYFYRGGSLLTSAIRFTCEQWAKEKLSDAGTRQFMGGGVYESVS